MSAVVNCPGCQMGEHDRHVYHWNNPGEGILGGAVCECKGDCQPPDLSWLFGPLLSQSDEPHPFSPEVGAVAALLRRDYKRYRNDFPRSVTAAQEIVAAVVDHLGLVEVSRDDHEIGYFDEAGKPVFQYAGLLHQCEDVLKRRPEWFHPKARILTKRSTWLQSKPQGEWREVPHGDA